MKKIINNDPLWNITLGINKGENVAYKLKQIINNNFKVKFRYMYKY